MKIGGEEIEFTDNSGSVTIASSVMTDLVNGEYELIIATDVGSCFATVNVLKKVKISTVEEFLAIENDRVLGLMYMLGAWDMLDKMEETK